VVQKVLGSSFRGQFDIKNQLPLSVFQLLLLLLTQCAVLEYCQRYVPPPTSRYIMDASRLDEEKAAPTTDIADASAGLVLNL